MNKPSTYLKEWEVYISQCGPNSQLKLTEISNIFQQTAALHSALWGMSYFDMQKFNQAWVLSTMRIEIIGDLPKWHQKIDAETWIESLKGMRSIRDFEISHKKKVVAKASSLWVVLNTLRRRPEPLAIPYHDLIQFPDRKATTIPTGKIDLSKPAKTILTHQVKYSDLDIVGHVNNVKYMEWCLDSIDRELLDQNQIKAIDLNFLKEINYNDEIEIKRYNENTYIYFYITRNEEISFAMCLETNNNHL